MPKRIAVGILITLVLATLVVAVVGKMRLDSQQPRLIGRAQRSVLVQSGQMVRVREDGGFDIIDKATDVPVAYDLVDRVTGEVTHVTPTN